MARLVLTLLGLAALAGAGAAHGQDRTAPTQFGVAQNGGTGDSYDRFRYSAPQAELPAPGAALTGGREVKGRDVGYSREWTLSGRRPTRRERAAQAQWGVFVAASSTSVASESRDDVSRWSDPAFSDLRDESVISKVQAGLVWRKGGAKAAFGYVRRSVKAEAPVNNDVYANMPKSDHVAGVTFSFTPR